MKTLIFNGSPRKNGGTATLIQELKKQLNGETTVVETYYAGISPCIDCRYCWTKSKCAIDDEMQTVYNLINEADNIVIASPIYFAELTGPLLSVMSRLQSIWVAKHFCNEEILTSKDRCGIVILVDAGEGCVDTATAMAKRLLRNMGAQYKDYVYFSGTENVVKTSTEVPESILGEVKRLAGMLNKGVNSK